MDKGLCDTCANEKKCIFSRKFPVLQCEEFIGSKPKSKGIKKKKHCKKIS